MKAKVIDVIIADSQYLIRLGLRHLFEGQERINVVDEVLKSEDLLASVRRHRPDVVIFDPNEEWIVDPEKFHSKSHNTPFGGMSMKGKVKMTLVEGRLVYDARSS